MRQFIIAAAMAVGLVALWAAILPLTAQPAPKPASASAPPGLSKALFLCRGKQGIDQACAAALARSLVFEEPVRACRADPEVIASLQNRRG